MRSVYCSGSQCGHLLGEVGLSMVAMNPHPVWRIQPGWRFREGILEMDDETYQAERRLSHEVFGRQRIPTGAHVAREANLPLVVRCPTCHRMRWVAPDALLVRT